MISVLIPVKNGGQEFARCLDAISRQQVDEEFEVVVVDSGSEDGTPALARSRGAQVHEIPAAEFHHGETRNLAAALASGDKLVFTTHDAYPPGEDWLARLTSHLEDPTVGGTYGRQIPHLGAKPPEQFFLDFVYGPRSREQTAASVEELSMDTTLFSNVNSAMRRDVWERFRFSGEIIMSEDQEWSQRVLLAGFRLVYDAEAAVHHSHAYTLTWAFRHFFDLGISGEDTWLAGARPSRKVLRRNAIRYGREELAWLWRSGNRRWIPYTVVYEGTKWLGLTLGTNHRFLPEPLKRQISKMPTYWEQRRAAADSGKAQAVR